MDFTKTFSHMYISGLVGFCQIDTNQNRLKRGNPPLRNFLHRSGLWVSLRSIFFIAD